MGTIQSISVAIIVLLLTISGNTTTVAILQSSIDLRHMEIAPVFDGTPEISADDYSFSCILKENLDIDSFNNSGNFQKITSNSIINASLSDQELKSLVYVKSESAENNVWSILEFHRTFTVKNLKQISFIYDWFRFAGLSSGYSEYVNTDIECEYILSSSEGYVDSYFDALPVGAGYGEEKIFQFESPAGGLVTRFDTPYTGDLFLWGSLRLRVNTGYFVSEPGATGLILIGVTTIFGALAIRMKKIMS